MTPRKLWVTFGREGNGGATRDESGLVDPPMRASHRRRARACVRSTFDRRVDMSARTAHADVAEAWPTRPQRDFDASMRCGICGDFYEMPVSFRGCHHAFCSDCVRRALPVMEKCPTCREPAEERDLLPNKALEHAVECYKRVRDELLGTTLAERDARARGEREGTMTTTTTGRMGSSARVRTVDQLDEPSRPVIERDDEFVEEDDDDEEDAEHDAIVLDAEEEEFANCPVCDSKILIVNMNVHLNSCLVKNERLSSPGRQQSKRARTAATASETVPKRLPKLAYHVFALNKLREMCKNVGLNSSGDKKQLEVRHKEFTTRVNSIIEYGRVPDLPAIAREVNREEQRKHCAGAKARIFNTMATSKEKATATSVKTCDATFARLIEEVRNRQRSKNGDVQPKKNVPVEKLTIDDHDDDDGNGEDDWHDEEILPLSQMAPRYVPTDDDEDNAN